ncbi:MAG: AraC family transcriptional regulator [Deltaproteobacteria bacterium]|nr:AraC family transcriptional regulator [Deltaproteobacteria bacterium]
MLRDAPRHGGWPVTAARWTYSDVGTPNRAPVTHGHASLAFQTGGHSRVEQNGEWTVRAGDVLIVPAGQRHRTLESRRPELWGVALDVPCFASQGARPLLEPFERVRDGASAVVRIPTERHAFLEDLFRELEQTGRGPRGSGEVHEAVQRSLLTLILHEVERATHDRRDRTTASGGGVVVESLRFIERNCLRPLTLQDVAAAVGRTPTYVTSALTKATGRSAVQWIVGGRMAEARRRLLHADEQIDIIAERVGYADATHFIRMFRRAHGATPAAWRAANRLT